MLEVLSSIGRVLSGLRDWKFDDFVVEDLIRIGYLLTVLIGALFLVVTCLGLLIQDFTGFGAKIAMILWYVVAYVSGVVGARISAEILLVVFRILYRIEGDGRKVTDAGSASSPRIAS